MPLKILLKICHKNLEGEIFPQFKHGAAWTGPGLWPKRMFACFYVEFVSLFNSGRLETLISL